MVRERIILQLVSVDVVNDLMINDEDSKKGWYKTFGINITENAENWLIENHAINQFSICPDWLIFRDEMPQASYSVYIAFRFLETEDLGLTPSKSLNLTHIKSHL